MISLNLTDAKGIEEPSVVRALGKDETDAMLALMCRSFSLDPNSAKRIFYSDPFFRLDMKRVLVGADSGALISCMTLVPTVMRINQTKSLSICGIAGVCTQPALRGRGYARRLIQQTLFDISDELGYAVTALTADRPEYYEHLGWALCGVAVDWTAPARVLPRCAESRLVRDLRADELDTCGNATHKVYDSARGNIESGAFERDGRRWRCIEKLDSGRRVAVFERDGNIAAYAAYDVRISDGARQVYVREIVASEAVARRALLGHFGSGALAETVSGRCSESDAVALGLFTVPAISVKTRRNLFMRVTHLANLASAILDRMQPTDEVAKFANGFAIAIDEGCGDHAECGSPTGRHSCLVRAAGRRMQVSPNAHLNRAEHWITGGAGAITQMLIGFKSASDLHAEGRIRVSDDTIVRGIDAILPRVRPFLAVPDVF